MPALKKHLWNFAWMCNVMRCRHPRASSPIMPCHVPSERLCIQAPLSPPPGGISRVPLGNHRMATQCRGPHAGPRVAQCKWLHLYHWNEIKTEWRVCPLRLSDQLHSKGLAIPFHTDFVKCGREVSGSNDRRHHHLVFESSWRLTGSRREARQMKDQKWTPPLQCHHLAYHEENERKEVR